MDELTNTADKTPIEIALKVDDEGFTTAKKLYAWLELDESHYAKWVRENITENPYVGENEFSPLSAKTSEKGGRPTKDYRIHASLAEKIAMVTRSTRGEEARNYFIGCEQALKRIAEQKRQTELERAKGIAIRQALTKAIQQSGENDRMHGHAYSVYTDIVYKAVFGKSARQLREIHGAARRDSLRDFFTEEELSRVEAVERLVSSLIDMGYGYDDVRGYIAEPVKRMREREPNE